MVIYAYRAETLTDNSTVICPKANNFFNFSKETLKKEFFESIVK
jgi:hypothetical protein